MRRRPRVRRSRRGRRVVRRPTRRTRRRVVRKRRVSRGRSRLIEKKTVTHGAVVQVRPIDDVNFPANVIPLTATNGFLVINQGVTNGQRIGNRISVKKYMLRMVFTLNDRDPNPTAPSDILGPVFVRLWFFRLKPKLIQSVASAADIASNNWFQFGAGASLGIQGNVSDLIQPINKEYVSLITTRTYKLGRMTTVWGNVPAPANNNAVFQYNWANNDSKLTARCRINLTRMLPRDWTFEDGQPTNATQQERPVYMMVTLHPQDGREYDTNGYTGDPLPVNMWYRLDLDYTDM